MLPPSPPTIFLCSPLLPNPQCTAYHSTAADSTAHILADHADIAAIIAAHGRLRVYTLPVPMLVCSPSAAGGTHVWFCSCCERYHRSEADLQQHLHAAGHAAAILDLVGQHGLQHYITSRCQRMLVADTKHAEDAAVDAAVAAVPPRPVEAAQPGFNIRVHFSAPYARGSVLVFLRTPSIAALTAVVDREYRDYAGPAAVDWAARFRTGVAVRFDLRGGLTGRRVLQRDEDLELDFGRIDGMEAFFGDRRENGGVSTRG